MSVNAINHEDIENYKQMLEKHRADETAGVKHGNYYDGYSDAMTDAINLVEELDESQKVVIPQSVADWIREAAQPSNLATISVMHSDAIRYGKHIDWFKNPDNQRLLLKALLYGYEIEKEPELHVKLKGLVTGAAYLNFNIPFKTFSTNSLSSPKHMNTEFTKSWLAKNWPEYDAYNNAGLLEFEEVEDE